MAIVDVEGIINGTPQKRLINGYNKMKENYNESTAQEYYDLYNKESLSFLMENSRLIFSEPYFGLSFYKERVTDPSICNFNNLNTEYEKVNEFIEENGSHMNESQRAMYEDLKSSLNTLLEHTKNTCLYSEYIKEHVNENFENNLSKLMYEYKYMDNINEAAIVNLFENSGSNLVNITYIPYAVESTGNHELYKYIDAVADTAVAFESCTEDEWREFTECTVCLNKLSHDSIYKEAVNSIRNKNTKIILEYFMNASLKDKLNELVEERVNISKVVYNSPVSAINNIFYDIQESVLDKEEIEAEREKLSRFKAIAYESTMNALITEYQYTDNLEAIAEGYSLIGENKSVEDMYNTIHNLYISEAPDEEDVTDDELEDMENDVNGGTNGKKPLAPKPKNLAVKVQNKYMDKEAKQMQKSAQRKQTGHEIKNAIKAVTRLPLNVINDIKDMVRKVDEKDDLRRKNFMTKPGFRKKAFRNLKLAILYGTAANAKLSLVPITAMCRHFSKQKDIRIRNELTRELQTEIKVCEEKLSDANMNSDKNEKYRLIRIKDQLEAEMVRVKLNSKYI